MEQSIENGTPTTPTVNNKSSIGLKIATTIACIVAICSIGFGIWTIINKNTQMLNSDEQILALKLKINSLEKQKEELESEIQLLKKQDDEKPDEQTANSGNSMNTWPVTAILVENEIHFINDTKEIVKKDDSYSFVRIKECQTLEEDHIVRCAVETTYDTDGDDRGVIYYGDSGKLEHWSASGW